MQDGTPRTSTQAPRSGFRPDIQGLRAVAVLVVVVNHVSPGLLPGGYVGVDVFFVVSGYLITSLLLREGARHGRISLTDFYARRARRILPAATLVAVVTVVGSLVTLSLIRTQTVLVDAVWASLFAANVRLALTGTDYFAQGQPPSPLRHYWSLAVEEQFYLVWPLVLVALLLWLRRRARGGGSGDATVAPDAFRRAATVVVALVVVASLAWSVWATWASPTTAYYSSFARAHELAIGAACALLAPRVRLGARTRGALALLGLAAVLAATWWIGGATPFPAATALLPVLGTAALVLAGEGGHETRVGRLLSVPPMRAVGDWSFSLYLWHWPLIVLVRSTLGPERFYSPDVILGLLVATFALSWASFRWVEEPFRRGRPWRRTSWALAIYPVSVATVALAVVASSQVVGYRLGEWSDEPAVSVSDYADHRLGRDPYVALVRASVLAAQEGRSVPSDLTPGLLDLRAQTASLGDCDYRDGTTRLCPLGDPDAARTIVVLGDSHARAISPAVVEIGRKHGYRVHVLVYSGCNANGAVQVERTTGRVWDACEEFKDWAIGTIEALSPELVVVSTSAGRFIDPATGRTITAARDLDRYLEVLHDGWRDLFSELGQHADRVAVFGNTPRLPVETGVCLTRGRPDLGDCAFPPGPQARQEALTSFAAAREVGSTVVDAAPWFCADGLCPSVVGGYVTMRDSQHVTPDYSRWLATPLAEALGVVRRGREDPLSRAGG